MNLGQLLGGAGVVGQGWREEEDAQRRTRQLELQTAELNRLDRLRQEMANAPMPAAMPQFPIAQQLPVLGVQPAVTAAPAAPSPAFAQGDQSYANKEAARAAAIPARPAAQLPPAPPAGTPARKQWEQDRLALLKAPTAALDVIQAPAAGALNLVTMAGEQVLNIGGRLVNAVTGAEVAPTDVRGPRWSMTPFYDKYVRQQEMADEAAAAGAQREAAVPTAQLPQVSQLTQAMIRVESGGKPGAVSPKGAVGLMQVKPDTAMKPGFGLPSVFDYAEQAGVQVGKRNAAEAKRLLADPTIGAGYGQQYMNAMLARYNNNLEYALAAYNAGPDRVDKWLASGADVSKLPKETREYVPKVLAALGAPAPAAAAPAAPTAGLNIPGVSTAQAVQPAAEPTPVKSEADFYLANPQAIPLDMQRAMQQRDELARLAGMYQRAGMGSQFMEVRAKVMELDNGMTYLQGMQGLQEFELASDPRRLAAVWSQYAGVPIGIQPRTDGKFDIVVNGRKTKTGISPTEIADSARSAFDATYRQQKATTSAKYGEETFKAQLKMQENQAQQLAQMIREIAVQRTQGNMQLAVEQLKQMRYDVKPTGSGDGTLVITPPGGGTPYLYNPTAKTVSPDGVKIESNAAYPISGLPSYGGVQPR